MAGIAGSAAPASLASVALLVGFCGCGSPRSAAPGDPELAAASTSARRAFDQGRVESAAQLYQHSLARARVMDDPSAIAEAAYNLAACLTEMGRFERARVQLTEAKAEARRAGGRVIDILLVEAMVARLQGQPGDARALADQVFRQRPSPTDIELLQVHILRGEIACDLGDSAAAAGELKGVNDATVSSLPLRARLAAVLGRIHLLNRNWSGAAKEFDREADLMRRARRYRSMSSGLTGAGGAYEAAGDYREAADRRYRAARSLFGLGDTAEAAGLVGAARDAARKAGAIELERRADSLAKEIGEAAGPR